VPIGHLGPRTAARLRLDAPVLDLMQTLADLRHLIPAMSSSASAMVPGLIATVIFRAYLAPIRLPIWA